MREFSFIEWVRSQASLDARSVPVGPGDDCAVLALGAERLLATTDQCADGVHFVLAECGPERAGYKVMARGLSDIAAMAGVPVAAVATVALPRGTRQAQAQAIYRGMRRAGDAFGCPLVGGDVTAWDHPLLLTATVFGRPGPAGVILRSGAQHGDAICVTGRLGGSLASGKHLDFTPRVREASELARRCSLHAMIDVSDGLVADLRHICRESGVGAALEAGAIPLSEAAANSADPLAAALGDGEDYELLFTLPAEEARRLLADQPIDVAVSRIGTVVAGEALNLIQPDGSAKPLSEKGFEHRT